MWSCGAVLREGLPGSEAIKVQTRVKSIERRRPGHTTELPAPPPAFLFTGPISSLLVLKLLVVDSLPLVTKSSNSPRSGPCACSPVSWSAFSLQVHLILSYAPWDSLGRVRERLTPPAYSHPQMTESLEYDPPPQLLLLLKKKKKP